MRVAGVLQARLSTSLTEIRVEEPLSGPEIIRVMRRGVPLTPLAEQLGYLF